MRSIRLSAVCCFVLAIAFSGCGASHDKLPEGLQTITGTLRSTELSRVRRGTHIIEREGEALYFVESGSRNLRMYEGREVTLTGTLEANTDRKALPVLVLKDIQSETAQTRTWKIPALRMSLAAPEDWQGRTSGSGMTFRLTGRTDPLLNVRTTPVAELPKGESILVGIDQGRMVKNQDGNGANVYVRHGSQTYLFQFTPPPDAYLPYLEVHLRDLLRTVSFDAQSSSSAFSMPSAGSGTVMTGTGSSRRPGVCGGAAGWLCPAGQYCEVTDQASNTGVCRPLR